MNNWIPDMWQRKVAHSTEDEYKTFSECAEHIRDHHPELLNGDEYRAHLLSPKGAARIDWIHTPERIQHMIRSLTRMSHPEDYNEICGCGNPAYGIGTDGHPTCKEHFVKQLGDAGSEAHGHRWLYNQNPPVLDSDLQELDNIPSFTDKEWENMAVTFNGKPHTGSRINWQRRHAINSKEEFNTAWGNDELQPAEQQHADLTDHIEHLAATLELGGVKENHLQFFLHSYPKLIFDDHKILHPECTYCEDEGR